MVPEFIIATRNLKDSGSVSAPFTTPFGWHIIKLTGRKPVGTFEQEEAAIRGRLEKDVRNKLSEESVLNKIKQEYGFKEYPKAKDAVRATLDSAIMKGEWTVAKAAGLDKFVFTLGDTKFSQQELAKYIEEKQARRATDLDAFFNDTYKSFVMEKCFAYEDSKLEEKYPDFRMLVQEYHDGILLFDLTDKKVWSKAVKDTSGLAAFYSENKSKYMWDQRFNASVVTILKPAQVNSEEVRKMFAAGKSTVDIVGFFNTDTTLNLLVETSKFSEGDSPIIDQVTWKSGLSPMLDSPSGPAFVYGYEVIHPEPKTLQESKGLVTADYQAYLETQWIQELKLKYPVIINEEVLSTLK